MDSASSRLATIAARFQSANGHGAAAEHEEAPQGNRIRIGDRLRALSGARLDLMCRVRSVAGKSNCCPAHCLAFLYAMVDAADADGCTRLHIEEIAERCMCSRRTAQRVSEVLQDEGVIVVEHRIRKAGVPKSDSHNRYAVVWTRLEELREMTVDAAMAEAIAELGGDVDPSEADEEPAAPTEAPKIRPGRGGPRPRTTGDWSEAIGSIRTIAKRRLRAADKACVESFVDIAEAMAAIGCTAPSSVEDADPSVILRYMVPGWQVLIEASDECGAAIVSVVRDDGGARRG